MKFQEYMRGEFQQEAVNFIVRTGLQSRDLPHLTLVENLNVQMRQVKEEVLELFTAYGTTDTVEIVDGIIDTHFTWCNFEFMVNEIKAMSVKDPKILDVFEGAVSAELIDLVGGIAPVAFQLKLPVDQDVLLGAARLIIENNRLKYTQDSKEAYGWEIEQDGTDIKVVSTAVDGSIWYCLKDKHGKVRKHKNFQKVKLEDLVGDNE